ncbi:hypothetical protein [Maribacter sp. 2-571]|uniref:hypothetical protein n=1 Tax=Maribacter sp. 2-571 TaxID=3417569 RepID=UPI003D34C40D
MRNKGTADQNEMTKNSLHRLFWKKKFQLDFFVLIMIVSFPLLPYFHVFVDSGSSSLNIFGFSYEHNYISSQNFVWQVVVKLVALGLCIIWFITNFHWWNWFLVIPLAFYIDSLVRRTFYYSDIIENNLAVFSFTVASITLCFLVWIKLRFKKYFQDGILFKPGNLIIQKKAGIPPSSFLFKTKPAELDLLGTKDYLRHLYFNKGILKKKKMEVVVRRTPPAFRYVDIIVIISIVSVPFVYYSFLVIESGITVYSFGPFLFGSNGFPDFATFYWMCVSKITIFVPMAVWFVTCQHWWKYAILSPIMTYFFQLRELF